MKRVYLDNAATTPLSKEAESAMAKYFSEEFGNADSRHADGRAAAAALSSARERIAHCLNASFEEIYFTSGGTESDNWALKGAALRHGRGRLAVSAVEHPAVFESAKQLERLGYGLTVIPVDGECAVDMRAVEEACRDAFLVSVMTANNETGRIQPVREIARLCRSHGVLFHTDAVQAAGCLPLDVRELDVDMLSLSGSQVRRPQGLRRALYQKWRQDGSVALGRRAGEGKERGHIRRCGRGRDCGGALRGGAVHELRERESARSERGIRKTGARRHLGREAQRHS